MNKYCNECGTFFHKRKKEGKRDWDARRFCGLPCYRLYQKKHPNKGTFQKGNHPRTEFKAGHKKPAGAHSFPKGEKHPNWKGENVGYSGLHMWVNSKLGMFPPQCEFCAVKGKKNGRQWSIHWANKSGRYKRDISDWIALCVPCHRKYDNASRPIALSNR